MLDKNKIREKIRELAIEISGGCVLQEGEGDGKPYPCGTCFCAGLGQLIDEESEAYKDHNQEVDRINEVWRFLLQLRDEKYKEPKENKK